MHSTSAHSGTVFPSKSESRGVQAAFFENQDFLQRRQTKTDAREHLPGWKAPALPTQKLLTDKSGQAPWAVLCKQSCCTILSRARQHGQGQAGEVRHEPTPAPANSSPPRRVSVQFLGTHLSESPFRTKPQQGDGVWSSTQAPGTGYASISSQSTHLAFSTVNSWSGFSQNFCEKKHGQSHLWALRRWSLHSPTLSVKPFQGYLQH